MPEKCFDQCPGAMGAGAAALCCHLPTPHPVYRYRVSTIVVLSSILFYKIVWEALVSYTTKTLRDHRNTTVRCGCPSVVVVVGSTKEQKRRAADRTSVLTRRCRQPIAGSGTSIFYNNHDLSS